MLDPLTDCDECGAEVYPDDVFRTVPIPKAPGFIALVFKCASCTTVGKLAKEHSVWDDLEASIAYHHKADEDRFAAMMRLELEGDITVEYLKALWASLPTPPLREAVMGSCMCDTCKTRRGF